MSCVQEFADFDCFMMSALEFSLARSGASLFGVGGGGGIWGRGEGGGVSSLRACLRTLNPTWRFMGSYK